MFRDVSRGATSSLRRLTGRPAQFCPLLLILALAGCDGTPASPEGAFLFFASVNAGGLHTCGVATDGSAYCWGANQTRQLGRASGDVCGIFETPCSTTPVRVSGGLAFRSVSAGGSHTCGLTTDGTVYCWGDNRFGELGSSTSEECGGAFPCSTTPLRVSGGLVFRSVSAGGFHTCGLAIDGMVYCWGSGGRGQLGNGSTASTAEPVAVAGGLSFASISVGDDHSCGVTTDATAYCWGGGDWGKLGNGLFEAARPTPSRVASRLRFTSIGAGIFHTCAVASDDAAYCWGANFWGQLGTLSVLFNVTPVAVTGGQSFASVSAGLRHTCSVPACWGGNSEGQLGNATRPVSITPLPIAGGLTFAQINAGTVHTCAVGTDGVVYCWGWNANGQLGDGSTTPRGTPVRVLGPG